MNYLTITPILAVLTIIAQVSILLFFILVILNKTKLKSRLTFITKYWKLVENHAFIIALIITLISILSSLFYSEIIGYEPCKLCWYQRVFMYPLIILIGLAIIKKQKQISDYVLALSVIGIIISIYHYGLQILALAKPGFSDACSATGVSCASTQFREFGYITIPLMVFTAFLIIIILMYSIRRTISKNNN